MKRFFFCLVAVLVLICSVALAATYDSLCINGVDYQYEMNDNFLYADLGNNEVALVLYIGSETSIDLNNAVEDKKVTRIEDESFNTNSIHSHEFNGKKYTCQTKITDVVLPDGLEYLGLYAFGSNLITNVDIPSGVKLIRADVFTNNPLEVIPYVSESTRIEGSFGGINCKAVSFDERYTNIPDYFMPFANVDTLNFHEGITTIGDKSFYNVWIKSLALPETLTKIGSYAFLYCENIPVVVLPDSIVDVGVGAFSCCRSLKSVELSAGMTEIGEGVFSNDEKLSSVLLKDGLTKIGKEAFSGCGSLPKITLPSSLVEIDNYAFCQCKKLSEIVIPENVKAIGIEAFSGCSMLARVVLPAGIESISNDAFDGCATNIKFEVVSGSYAEQWAMENGYKVNAITPVNSVNLSETDAVINKGKTLKLKAEVGPEEATNKKIVWSTSDKSIATVEAGTVTAKACGECDIICEAADGYGAKAVCHVNVIQMVQSISVSQKKIKVDLFGNYIPELKISPADATDPSIVWESSDPSIAVVDENGVIRGISGGDCTIKASAVDGSGKFVELTVHVPMFSVSIDPVYIPVGGYAEIEIVNPSHLSQSDLKISGDAFLNSCNWLSVSGWCEGKTKVTIKYQNDSYSFDVIVGPKPQEQESGDYVYTLDPDGNAKIKRYNGPINYQNLVIPEEIDGHPVVSLGSSAFVNIHSIIVTIPDSVIHIDGGCFSSCEFREINIPESVECLVHGCFSGSKLQRIVIPSSVTSILGNPFADCSDLRYIVVDPQNPYFVNIDGALVDKRDMRLIALEYANIEKNYSIPDGVRTVGYKAFDVFELPVKYVNFPETVKFVENYAFARVQIIEIAFDGIEEISPFAFSNCTWLKKVTLSDTIKRLGQNAFEHNKTLNRINLPAGLSQIDDNCFYEDRSLVFDVVPDSYGEKYVINNGLKYELSE